MSDDIFSVATPFSDVASLAQGYMNRADGERLLLPLKGSCKQGSGVRFVVYLGDGTPAFAGAGLCTQVSDQGNTVPADQRFETLLDTLQFDDRSRPVYEYIVAVRNAAYVQQQGAEPDAAESADADAVVDAADVEALPADGGHAAAEAEAAEETSAFVDAGDMAASVPPSARPAAYASDGELEAEPLEGEAAELEAEPLEAESAEPEFESEGLRVAEPEYATLSNRPAEMPSFIPPALPTGLLTRPARTTHWQPVAPRRPTPRPSTGLFKYGSSGLPRPARPPCPELDRAAWVQPAPRPAQ